MFSVLNLNYAPTFCREDNEEILVLDVAERSLFGSEPKVLKFFSLPLLVLLSCDIPRPRYKVLRQEIDNALCAEELTTEDVALDTFIAVDVDG